MDQEKLHRMSCRAARELLEDLECGNVEQMKENLDRISHYLSLAETVPTESLQGAALRHREQMELLGGISESLSAMLGRIREKAADELQGLRVNRTLLRHLVESEAAWPGRLTTPATAGPRMGPGLPEPPRFAAAGCTSPAYPTG